MILIEVEKKDGEEDNNMNMNMNMNSSIVHVSSILLILTSRQINASLYPHIIDFVLEAGNA